jgi:hypothetical protein
MAKQLLIVCALLLIGGAAAQAQNTRTPGTQAPAMQAASSQGTPVQPPGTIDGASPPPARLIKPHPPRGDSHPVERPRHPVDDRCKPMKDQLELELQKPGNQRRLFQAKLAHNAGTRFCREGHPDKGMAEFQRGLSYLQDTSH